MRFFIFFIRVCFINDVYAVRFRRHHRRRRTHMLAKYSVLTRRERERERDTCRYVRHLCCVHDTHCYALRFAGLRTFVWCVVFFSRAFKSNWLTDCVTVYVSSDLRQIPPFVFVFSFFTAIAKSQRRKETCVHPQPYPSVCRTHTQTVSRIRKQQNIVENAFLSEKSLQLQDREYIQWCTVHTHWLALFRVVFLGVPPCRCISVVATVTYNFAVCGCFRFGPLLYCFSSICHEGGSLRSTRFFFSLPLFLLWGSNSASCACIFS